MVDSKGWEWEKAKQSFWLKPSEDAHYLAKKWSDLGFKRVLDLGAGLGRHSIFFAQQGFEVTAIDISEYAVNYLKEWAKNENLSIECSIGDMVALPFQDDYFDCVFACHSISHTDTEGTKKIISEIQRVLKLRGEVYASMCSKDHSRFKNSGYPKIDENTILNKEEGPDFDVPHFFADREDILNLYKEFHIEKIRHIDYCFTEGEKYENKYYYINAYKNR